ncbi:hypothetical protein F4810DRAFT_425928 [Camillea tinctor]|nr:hypothetical protein F4810DRAFT_425928 [Camillea tinctor]
MSYLATTPSYTPRCFPTSPFTIYHLYIWIPSPAFCSKSTYHKGAGLLFVVDAVITVNRPFCSFSARLKKKLGHRSGIHWQNIFLPSIKSHLQQYHKHHFLERPLCLPSTYQLLKKANLPKTVNPPKNKTGPPPWCIYFVFIFSTGVFNYISFPC